MARGSQLGFNTLFRVVLVILVIVTVSAFLFNNNILSWFEFLPDLTPDSPEDDISYDLNDPAVRNSLCPVPVGFIGKPEPLGLSEISGTRQHIYVRLTEDVPLFDTQLTWDKKGTGPTTGFITAPKEWSLKREKLGDIDETNQVTLLPLWDDRYSSIYLLIEESHRPPKEAFAFLDGAYQLKGSNILCKTESQLTSHDFFACQPTCAVYGGECLPQQTPDLSVSYGQMDCSSGTQCFVSPHRHVTTDDSPYFFSPRVILSTFGSSVSEIAFLDSMDSYAVSASRATVDFRLTDSSRERPLCYAARTERVSSLVPPQLTIGSSRGYQFRSSFIPSGDESVELLLWDPETGETLEAHRLVLTTGDDLKYTDSEYPLAARLLREIGQGTVTEIPSSLYFYGVTDLALETGGIIDFRLDIPTPFSPTLSVTGISPQGGEASFVCDNWGWGDAKGFQYDGGSYGSFSRAFSDEGCKREDLA